jgi:hypothetical protein
MTKEYSPAMIGRASLILTGRYLGEPSDDVEVA